MKIKSLLFVLVALLVMGVATQADSVALHVSVHDGHLGSTEILASDFAVGERHTKNALRVEQSVSGHSLATAELYNNLCIAQIKLDKLEHARSTCKQAVSHAMQLAAGIGQNRMALKRVKAAALSNRGVLNMLDGNRDRALADFSKARKLGPSLETIQLNMTAATGSDSHSGLAVVFN